MKLPEGATLIPGVVGHCTDFIEHPDLVAERLVRYAKLVGRENVLAGTHCGLGTRVATRRSAGANSRQWPKVRGGRQRLYGAAFSRSRFRRRYLIAMRYRTRLGSLEAAHFSQFCLVLFGKPAGSRAICLVEKGVGNLGLLGELVFKPIVELLN